MPTRTWGLLGALTLVACTAPPRPAPRPRPPARVAADAGTPAGTPAPTPTVPDAPPSGQSIVVAGVSIPIGVPVVTWRDPGGYDATLRRCFFEPGRELPTDPAAGCDTPERYAERRDLPPQLASKVAAEGWTPENAAAWIDQVVIHYDVAWTSQNCFKVLHDRRGLSCHFLLDVDGTLYQTLDVVERARHAAGVNDRAVGIEIAHPGPLELTPGLKELYRADPRQPGGVVFDLGPLAEGVRTPGFVVRPARARPVRGFIHGQAYTMYDFTEAQYETLARLLVGLERALPRLKLDVPRGPDGRVRASVLSQEELASWQGLLGHYHVTVNKQDPGPAFDWTKLLLRTEALLREAPAPTPATPAVSEPSDLGD